MSSIRSLIRQVHLLTGLALALAVLFYAVSGALIVHGGRLPPNPPRVTIERIPLPPGAAANDAVLRDFMETTIGRQGRPQPVAPYQDGRLRLRHASPGRIVEAELAPNRSEIIVTRTSNGGLRLLRVLHTLTGYGGGARFFAWSLLLDLVATATIGFAISGIYLWYRMSKDRRLGWLILGGSWCYTVGLIAYLALT